MIKQLPPCAHAICLMLRGFDPKSPHDSQTTRISVIDSELFSLITKHSLLHLYILSSLVITLMLMAEFVAGTLSMDSLMFVQDRKESILSAPGEDFKLFMPIRLY